MTPFVQVAGIAAVLMRNNVDTDQITPGRTVMKVESSGFGSGLFYNWRYLEDGSENPSFILNQPRFREARFLIAGSNFGCGSSRETAVWALRDFGIRAVIAPSFGGIFTSNCFKNGVVPIVLDGGVVVSIASEVIPGHEHMTVDLEHSVVISPLGIRHAFHIPALQRELLLEGLETVDAIRKREPLIAEFQDRDAIKRPWVYTV